MSNADSQKTILITGAARGIGAHLAMRFAGQGWRVAANYCHSKERTDQLCAGIEEQYGSGSALAVYADVRCRSDVRSMCDQIEAAFGHLDVLVNNAGINRDGPFLEMTDEQWDNVVATILTGSFICSQEFARRYSGDHGHIVNIGSLTAFTGRRNGANYCAARAGVVALTKCLALELAPRIRVNAICPGYILTPMQEAEYTPEMLRACENKIPLGRMGRPEDVAALFAFLASDDASFITGQAIVIDGGEITGGLASQP